MTDSSGRQPTILIQNYHPPATTALIRDFKTIGFRVLCPDSNWGRISYYAPNDGLGGELIDFDSYMASAPGHLLICCKPQEEDMKAIARQHGDVVILNVAQHLHTYEEGLSDILICPDILTFEHYPEKIKHKLLYFPRPFLSIEARKDAEAAYRSRRVCSYISMPQWWPGGTRALDEFAGKYPHEFLRFGNETPDGPLTHTACNRSMVDSFLTIHFKEHEAYGLSCLESMMLGTPVVGLERFMHDKTLGRFFLTKDNSIVAKSIDEAVERALSLSLDEYEAMSKNCRQTVMSLTRTEVTTDVLSRAVWGTG